MNFIYVSDEFKRAVKISTGHTIENHVVNVVFMLFDNDGKMVSLLINSAWFIY